MGNATREIERAVDDIAAYLHAVACDLVAEDHVLRAQGDRFAVLS